MSTKIIAKGRRTGPLPPAGDARREELKRRSDDLEALGEELEASGEIEGAAIDPARLAPDPEIRSQFDRFNRVRVSGAQPEFVYVWEGIRNDGLGVQELILDGWEVVTADMPEAKEHRTAEGTRRIGDTLLLRKRKDAHLLAVRQARAHRRTRREGITSHLLELESKHQRHGRGVRVVTDLNDPVFKRAIDQAVASQLADKKFAKALREGTVEKL